MQITDRTRDARNRATSTGKRARRALAGEANRAGWVGTALIAAVTAAAGALAAFLMDPARGPARRARLIDQSAATVRRAARHAGRAARYARSSVSGRFAAARHAGTDSDPFPDDVTLTSKVQAELFGDPSVPKGSININVERGVVVLRGEVPDADMRDRLAAEASAIDGVWSVHNLLHLPDEPIEQEPLAART